MSDSEWHDSLDDSIEGALDRVFVDHADLMMTLLREAPLPDAPPPEGEGGPAPIQNELLPPASGALGRFAIVPDQQPLGKGGSGVVLNATDTDLGREVAVKLSRAAGELDTNLEEAFFHEARITAALDHPGIVPIHEFGRTADGRPWIAMRRVAGESLAVRLERNSGTDTAFVQALLAAFEKVCETVAFAHARHIVHCDLKPANILLGACGAVYVVDWGLARRMNDAQRSMQRAGRVEGTPAWMAPEQARGEDALIGPATDVFSLGAILGEIITGIRPRDEETRRQVMLSARAGWMDALFAGLRRCTGMRDLAELALQCLQTDPAARPRDAGELARALATWRARMAEELHESRRVLEATELRAHAERRLRKRNVIIFLALIALGALAAALAWVHERALEREAQTSRDQVESALIKAASSEALARIEPARAEAHLSEAASILEHVAATPLPELPDAVRGRLEATRAALGLTRANVERSRTLAALLAKLNALRGPGSPLAPLDQQYSAVFSQLELGTAAADNLAFVETTADDAMREEIIQALDTWACVKRKLQQADGAARLARLASALDPDGERKALRLLMEQGDVPALLARAAAPVQQEHVAGALWLAEMLHDRGHQDAAMSLYRNVLATVPVDFRANREYAMRLHGARGSVEEVMKHLCLALAARPDNHSTRLDIVHVLLNAGRVPEAESWLAKLLADAPLFSGARITAAQLATQRQQYDAALAHVDHLLSASPDNATARGARAMVLRARGDEAGALVEFAEACRRSPGDDLAKLLYAGALQECGLEEDAVVWFERCIAAFTDNYRAHADLALALLRCGRDADAVRAFDAALARNPDHAESHCNRALALEGLGRLDEAATGMARGHALGSARKERWSYPSARLKARIEAESALARLLDAPDRNAASEAVLAADERLLRAHTLALRGHHEDAFRNFEILVRDGVRDEVLDTNDARLAARSALACLLPHTVSNAPAQPAADPATARLDKGLEWLEHAISLTVPDDDVNRVSARRLQTAALSLTNDPLFQALRALDWQVCAPRHQARWAACWKRLDVIRADLRLAITR